MGRFELVLHSEDNPLRMEVIKCFMERSGAGEANMITVSSEPLQASSKYHLTKHQLQTYSQQHYTFMTKKLAIHDITYNSIQPFENPIQSNFVKHPELKLRPQRYLLATGEIYNYSQLLAELSIEQKDLLSNSDVEIIMPLYIKIGLRNLLEKLVGEFSFIIVDSPKTYFPEKTSIFAAKDIFGTRSLYGIFLQTGKLLMFVSELKYIPSSILNSQKYQIVNIPPGSYWDSQTQKITKYHSWDRHTNWTDIQPQMDTIYNQLQKLFKNSITTQIDTTLTFGIAMSNGFGSILLVGTLVEYLIENDYNFDTNQLHIFSVNNKKAVEYIQFLEKKYSIIIHHHLVKLQADPDLDDIVYTLECRNLKIISDSIPMYYLLKYIREMRINVKVIYTGDFLNLYGTGDSPEQIQKNSIKSLETLYTSDLMRIDKISNRWSFQVRHPYLNKELVTYILSLHPKYRQSGYWSQNNSIDKYVFRKSFQKEVLGYELIPEEFLWTKSEQFSTQLDQDTIDTIFYKYFNTRVDSLNRCLS